MSDNGTDDQHPNHLKEYVANVFASTTVLIENDKQNAITYLVESVRNAAILVQRLAPALEAAEADVWDAMGSRHGYGDNDASLPGLVQLRDELAALTETVDGLVAARKQRA